MENKIEIPNSLKDIINGTTAEFSHYKDNTLYYTVEVGDLRYEFPIDVSDKAEFGTETILDRTYKAITLMRYIRKAIAGDKLRWDKIV